MLVSYIRDENRKPFGCIIAIKTANDEIRYGLSLCNPKDRFTKKDGRRLALKNSSGQCISIPAYRAEAVRVAQEQMRNRVKKYFTHKVKIGDCFEVTMKTGCDCTAKLCQIGYGLFMLICINDVTDDGNRLNDNKLRCNPNDLTISKIENAFNVTVNRVIKK